MGGGVRSPVTDRTNFLRMVEYTASNLMQAVLEYNSLSRVVAGFPQVEVLQCCLVSGGAFRHPDTSKVDVAAAIVRGLGDAARGAATRDELPMVRFAYDEDRVFEAAVASA